MKIGFFHIFFSCFLLLSMAWQSTAKTLIYFNYELHKKEIAATLCENRMKPKSCCEGKCYLNKELKQEEKRQNDLPASLKDKSEKPSRQSTFKATMIGLGSMLQIIGFSYNSAPPLTHPKAIFHPPSGH